MQPAHAPVPDRARVEHDGASLCVTATLGEPASFPAVWLRDNCPCPACRDPVSGQRLLDVLELADDLAIAEARLADGALLVRFAPDGHEGRYPLEWLRGSAAESGEGQGAILWHEGFDPARATLSHDEVRRDPAALARWLAGLRAWGFALLTGVPCEDGAVARVAELFGHVRETNYGRVFDVRSVARATNLAYTARGLAPHTDNPYQEPVPSLQLLHCLAADAAGGDSILVDGLAAANALRAAAPEAFAVLAHWPVPFRYAAAGVDLRARAPLIELDANGRIFAVRFNHRSLGAVDLPAEVIAPWYAAYRRLARLIAAPERQVTFRMASGDLFMVDNRRVLHGRTAFRPEGARWLQGCYVERADLESTARILARSPTPTTEARP